MTSFAYITTLPCDLCDDRRTVRAEPPYDICRRSPFGDCEPLDEMTGEGCEKLAAVQEMSDLAVAVSSATFRHTPPEVRDWAIRGFADMFHDWARDIGAEFDADAWIARCGVGKAVAA